MYCLVACEESQAITKQLRLLGHTAEGIARAMAYQYTCNFYVDGV